MRYIGGFFELEKRKTSGADYHPEALNLCNGRACLNLIIRKLSPSKLYVPFYSCASLTEPVEYNHISYEFYAIDRNLEIDQDIVLQENEYIIYVNYFGLKNDHVHSLLKKYGDRIIIDNTQSFFDRSYGQNFSFNSVRKWFGTADGGYLYAPVKIDGSAFPRNEVSTIHLYERAAGNQEKAYKAFLEYEASIDCSIKTISHFSEEILSGIDYAECAEKRRQNYLRYEKDLAGMNQLKLNLGTSIPLFYPLFLKTKIDKTILFENGIFIPTFWSETFSRQMEGFDLEKELTEKLLPLPVDHRYDLEDCEKVMNYLKKCIN